MHCGSEMVGDQGALARIRGAVPGQGRGSMSQCWDPAVVPIETESLITSCLQSSTQQENNILFGLLWWTV